MAENHGDCEGKVKDDFKKKKKKIALHKITGTTTVENRILYIE
jgi:hypothetical protein